MQCSQGTLAGILTMLKEVSWLHQLAGSRHIAGDPYGHFAWDFWGGSKVWGGILKTGVSMLSQEDCRKEQILHRGCTLTVSPGAAVPAGSWCEWGQPGRRCHQPCEKTLMWEATAAVASTSFWLVMLLTGERRCCQNISGSCKRWMEMF